MSNSLRRFKANLEKTDYFLVTLTGPPKEQDTLRVVLETFPVRIEVPIVWKWEAESLDRGAFKNHCPRCQRLDTDEIVFVHFNSMEPMNGLEVLAWQSK